MNKRIGTVIATAMLLSITSGCCNLKSLWFGRGARCGLCNKFDGCSLPRFGNVMQAPCCAQPFSSPAPACQPAPYQAPAYQAPVYQAPQYQPPRCQAPQCQSPQYATPQCQSPVCQSAPACGCQHYPGETCYESSYGSDCGCQGMVHGSEVVHDPYLGGGVPYDGQIIGEQIIGDQVIEGGVAPGTIIGPSTPVPADEFYPRGSTTNPQGNIQGAPSTSYPARKFDSDGNKILWEEPLPGENSL